MVDTMTKLRNAARTFVQQHGREPTIEELAQLGGISVEEAGCIWRMSRQTVSLDQPLGDAEDGAVGDVITFERADARGRNRDARAFSAEVVGPGRAVIR
jgi:RNA polymerase primary sigma factor